jgi:hypothetical protein
MLPNFLCASLPSLEVIEHLENPRNFEREIRILKVNRRCLLTTPNQISLSSRLCLLLGGSFNIPRQLSGAYNGASAHGPAKNYPEARLAISLTKRRAKYLMGTIPPSLRFALNTNTLHQASL